MQASHCGTLYICVLISAPRDGHYGPHNKKSGHNTQTAGACFKITRHSNLYITAAPWERMQTPKPRHEPKSKTTDLHVVAPVLL